MIKRNELDVGNIDFELLAKVGDNFDVLYCFALLRIVHILATRCPIEIGFGSKCSM